MDDKLSFTPPPWACQPVDKEGPDFGVTIIGLRLDDGGQPMETPTNGIVGAALPFPTEIDSGDYSRVEANGHLMASAPELCSALRWLRAMWEPGSNHDTEEVKLALAAADAALAKARGEA